MTFADQPLLTIVITNYNHGQYLPKALDSLISQNFADFEILIIDDGSQDNSHALIKHYEKNYPFIRSIFHEKNRGVNFSLTEGASLAKGLYLHTMGSDDYRLPGFIEKTMAPLLRHPNIGIACSHFGYIKNEEGPVYTDRLYPKEKIFNKKETMRLLATSDFWIPGHTAIFKRNLALQYGGYLEKLQFLSDWFLLHTIAINEGVAFVPETLSVWWIRENSYSYDLMHNREKKRAIYSTLLQHVMTDPFLRVKFRKAALLRQAFDNIGKRTFIFKPKYWPNFAYFLRKTLFFYLKKVKLFRL